MEKVIFMAGSGYFTTMFLLGMSYDRFVAKRNLTRRTRSGQKFKAPITNP